MHRIERIPRFVVTLPEANLPVMAARGAGALPRHAVGVRDRWADRNASCRGCRDAHKIEVREPGQGWLRARRGLARRWDLVLTAAVAVGRGRHEFVQNARVGLASLVLGRTSLAEFWIETFGPLGDG